MTDDDVRPQGGRVKRTRGAGGHRPTYSGGRFQCKDCGWVSESSDLAAEMRADPCPYAARAVGDVARRGDRV